MVDDAMLQRLVEAAREARGRAHAPYSKFTVGAALLDEQGRIHAGCNIENAAYPECLCAEAVALAHLVMASGRRVIAAAVAGLAPEPVVPCWGCRQKLREFADDDAAVVVADMDAVLLTTTLGALLPSSFGAGHLR
jgi:cytidine deaminase